jgi:hypothetical protein
MPYEVIKLPSGRFSVINKITRHNFSPKGITKAQAIKQQKALYANLKDLEGGAIKIYKGKNFSKKGDKDDDDIIYDAMSDADLQKYFPRAKIVKYSEIPKGVGVEEWLKVGEVCYILYESTLNSGHWVALARGKDAVYYFDSYGNKPDVPLSWNDAEKNVELNQEPAVLTKMFSITKVPVYYNDYDYQTKKDKDVATCGRWATAFLTHFKKYGGNLKSFNKETLKRANGRSLDEFIANIYDE